MIKTDTVYIEKRDSILVKEIAEIPHQVRDEDRNEDTEKGGGFRSTLKWIFWIIIGLIALIITAKVCLRK